MYSPRMGSASADPQTGALGTIAVLRAELDDLAAGLDAPLDEGALDTLLDSSHRLIHRAIALHQDLIVLRLDVLTRLERRARDSVRALRYPDRQT